MSITLLRLLTSKAFDATQIGIWSCELFGVYTITRKVYSSILRQVELDEDEIENVISMLTAEASSLHVENQRQAALATIDILEKYFTNEDATEAIESFEEALSSFSRFFAPQSANPLSVRGASNEASSAH